MWSCLPSQLVCCAVFMWFHLSLQLVCCTGCVYVILSDIAIGMLYCVRVILSAIAISMLYCVHVIPSAVAIRMLYWMCLCDRVYHRNYCVLQGVLMWLSPIGVNILYFVHVIPSPIAILHYQARFSFILWDICLSTSMVRLSCPVEHSTGRTAAFFHHLPLCIVSEITNSARQHWFPCLE